MSETTMKTFYGLWDESTIYAAMFCLQNRELSRIFHASWDFLAGESSR